MIDWEKHFRLYVRAYNRLAARDGQKLYRGTAEPIRYSLYLRDLLTKRSIKRRLMATQFATPEEEAKFRADYFETRLRDDGDLLELGFLFKKGRRPNTGSPIRRKIAALLRKNPNLKNPELWKAVEEKPPKGWSAFDNEVGKYLEGPHNKNMNYQRFCNVCAEERAKAKAKITG